MSVNDRIAALESAVGQLQALNRLAQAISSLADVDEILQLILQEAMSLTHSTQGAIHSFNHNDPRPMHTLYKSSDQPAGNLNPDFSDLIGGWIMHHRQPLMVERFEEDARFQIAQEWFPGMRAVLAVPIMARQNLTGIIILTKSPPFSEGELQLITIVATQCGQLLENAKQFNLILQENRQLRLEVERRSGYHGIVGNSPPMQRLYDLLERVIPGDSRVLIEGESGTGKELIARTIHFNGPRKERKFVAVDCGALPEPLLESEFFGHVRGAFTGAIADKKGLFEIAHLGTLFLDEITNTNLVFQAKLLRVLQEGEIRPVGATDARKIEVRVIAATSTDLKAKVAAGEFREDLYYRLNVINLKLPPLRQRREDVPLLAQAALERLSTKAGKHCRNFSPAAMRALEAYSWPGNIRELENVIERAVALAHIQDRTITPELLPESLAERGSPVALETDDAKGNLPKTLEVVEKQMIRAALERHKGNRSKAARELGITRQTLITKIKKYKVAR